MVNVRSKFGVRSGNTLRALQSGRMRKYLHQAWLVGRSNIHPEEMPTFLDYATEDNLVKSTLRSTDVFLSLNRKERWNIPEKVSHLIETGSFDIGEATLSLLERHKLKRRANCLSFVCNQGRHRKVTPRQKRYFSFKLDNIDLDTSNRQRKRQKIDGLRMVKRREMKTVRERKEDTLKIVEAVTVSELVKEEDARRYLVSSKPEYRLEVYSPCPSSCSLTHNPKYTDFHLEVGTSGNFEMRSNTKPIKSKRRYKKRFTLRDLQEYYDDIEYNDEYYMWDYYYDPAADELVCNAESFDSYQESDDDRAINLKFSDYTDQWNKNLYCESNCSDNILESLISQAENARSQCKNVRKKHKKKASQNLDKDNTTNLDSKTHIVYTNENNPKWRYRNKRKKRSTERKHVTPESVSRENNTSKCGTVRGVSGCPLSKCGHSLFGQCWREHFRSKTINEAVPTVCPNYICELPVSPVMPLSLSHISEVDQLLQRESEANDSCPTSNLCANPYCCRFLGLVNTKGDFAASLDVSCSREQELCFPCLSQHHWPATCKQTEKYLASFDSIKPINETVDDYSFSEFSYSLPSSERPKFEPIEMEGRLCPECLRFIVWDGSCNHMVCICGFIFCWACMKYYYDFLPCIEIPSVMAKYKRKLIIRHLIIPKLFNFGKESTKKVKSKRSRKKTTFFQKAMQQRTESKKLKYHKQITEITRKIAHVSQKNLQLKTEYLTLCGIDLDQTDDNDLFDRPIAIHVTKFLRSCVEIKRALHHVAEFTFVRLQDTPDSVNKRRILKLADDLSGYCCFISSILEQGDNQDVLAAVKRLADIKIWTVRALNTLMCSVNKS